MAVQTPTLAPERRAVGRRSRFSPALLSAYLVITLEAVFCLLPFYLMFVYGTRSASDIFTVPPPSGLAINFSRTCGGFWRPCRSGATVE